MECPTPERLAAGAMTPDERGAWLDHAASCTQCRAVALVMSNGTPPTTAPDEPVGRIGRFVITNEIGRGAMGVVYAALDPELGRTIAIKVLHDTAAAERLRREARALARLAHDNVVRIYDVGAEGDRVFVAMELVAGQNLRQWLAAAPRALPEILRILLEAGRGLAAAHAAGIVHRDFKPDNVLVADTRVVVGDFGLSQLADVAHDPAVDALDVPSGERLTMTGAAVGTPAYMAPEQVLGESTAASDQFAYCVAAWEACYGVRPFGGATLRDLREHARAGFFTRPQGRSLPRRIESALRRGLAAEPTDRFPSMDALLAELAPRRRWRWIAAAAVLVVVGIVVAVWQLTRSEPDECTRASNEIDDHWTHAARTRVRDARGEPVVAALDAYVTEWRAARAASCRSPDKSPTGLERRAARDTCYERARLELARQVTALPTLSELRANLIPVAACTAQLPLPQAPGTGSDIRGCGCPYSACTMETHTCHSECNARAFRPIGRVPGIGSDNNQEAIVGATTDGNTLLYLSGKDCNLDHLFLARRQGDRFTSIDLTPQFANRGVILRENCCTLAADGRSLVVSRKGWQGFLRFPLDGDRVGDGDPHDFANLVPDLLTTERIHIPVLSADGLTLYFAIASSAAVRNGNYEAKRATITEPFGTGAKLGGRPALYEYVTGVSSDGLSLFMANEFSTRVPVRATTSEPFTDLGVTYPPSQLPGWRAIPVEHCKRIITTMTPGGCQSEDIVYLEAIGP